MLVRRAHELCYGDEKKESWIPRTVQLNSVDLKYDHNSKLDVQTNLNFLVRKCQNYMETFRSHRM